MPVPSRRALVSMRRGHRNLFVALLLLTAPAAAWLVEPTTTARAEVQAITVTALASPAELPIGAPLSVAGHATAGAAPLAGAALALQSAPYPYGTFTTVARTTAAADGSFAFDGVQLQQNSKLQVLLEGPIAASSPAQTIVVDPRVALHAGSLGPGRVRLSMRIQHLPGAGPGATDALWFLAARGNRSYSLAATTRTREISSGVTYASAIVNPPAKRFSYRVCLNPSWEAAMGPAASHGRCPHHGFRLPSGRSAEAATRRHRPRARAALEYGGEGRGIPLAPFPSAAAIAAASRFLGSRAGSTAMAVVDSSGRLSGIRTRAHFQTASVIKVMFLLAYLKRLAAAHRGLSEGDRALLYPMIHESNNNDASAVLGAVGEPAVERVAREAGMSDYVPGVGWWAYSETSAADQARLLWRLPALAPARFYGYARYLMSTIEPEQSWGFPPVARPAWQVYFKTGALPSRGLFNEVARLERGGVAFTVAVLTDGDPSLAYGEQTIEGVARRLLGSAR